MEEIWKVRNRGSLFKKKRGEGNDDIFKNSPIGAIIYYDKEAK